jgi:hypothetical protein
VNIGHHPALLHADPEMLTTLQFRLLLALGVLALVLMAVNAGLFSANRAQQDLLTQRQAYVQQTQTLEVLYREIAKALADLALRNGDRSVLDMLAAQGITVTPNPAPAPAAPTEPRR